MPLRVVELFAGVGGFRIGLEGPPGCKKDSRYAVVWSNQWEPSTKKQHAAEVYVERWGLTQSSTNSLEYHGEGETFINADIAELSDDEIPDHDLIVGGFPCQDYSVARTSAKGLEGVKGVLWWQIHRIMSAKKPKYAMLENVDRLLKSPTSQRGRDFAVMLASLAELGYVAEWRVINAADYGMPQRRRRVFILAYAPGTPQYEALKEESNIKQWIETDGTMAKAFPVKPLNILVAMPSKIKQNDKSDLADVSENFNKGSNRKSKSPFKKSGIMVGNNYYTYDTVPKYDGVVAKLSDVLLSPGTVPIEYLVEPESVMKTKGWKYLKGAKDEPRKGTDDFSYQYKEGAMIFPDALDKPSRTIITGEGGSTPSRFKHVVKFKPTKKMKEALDLDTKECQAIRKEFGLAKSEWLRRLTPVELERLNMFPDNHTDGPTDGKRAFFMGNALVCGVVKKLGEQLTPSNSKENHFVVIAKQLLQLFSNTNWSLDNQNDVILPLLKSPVKGIFGINLLGYSVNQDVVKYNGTQADPKKKKARRKQGLFDFLVITGDIENRYRTPTGRQKKKASHKDLFEDLLVHSTEYNCLRVWSGENPILVGQNEDEREVLVTMFLMMLEQEINWGEMDWQKKTNFWPGTYPSSPDGCRPRDMLMGFIRQAFKNGIERLEELKFWMFNFGRPPTTACFRGEGSFNWPEYVENNPEEAELFIELSKISKTSRVIDNGVEELFAEEANKHPDNPEYVEPN